MDQIRRLARRYSSQASDRGPVREQIRELYTKYLQSREATLLDAVAAAAGISGVVLSPRFDPSDLSPQMREAFELAYPSVPIESLADYSPEQLEGFINGWKGKLFEVIVRDRLNDGKWVGELHLKPGQYAELAKDASQPGWDLAIVDENGAAADQLQLKATSSLQYAREALERYPHIHVITAQEAAGGDPELLERLTNSGISEEELEGQVESALSPLADHSAAQGWLDDIFPFLPFVIIAGTEGMCLFLGKTSLEKAARRATGRALKAGASMGVGYLVYTLDGGLISIPATMITRLSIDRFRNLRRAGQDMTARLEMLRAIGAARNAAGYLPSPTA